MLVTPENQAEILTLYFAEKRSIRSIARELSVDRKTVKRVVSRRSVVLARKGPRAKKFIRPLQRSN